jgi:ABC-type nitrate/sulfonate/bicarbonate transport system permease component
MNSKDRKDRKAAQDQWRNIFRWWVAAGQVEHHRVSLWREVLGALNTFGVGFMVGAVFGMLTMIMLRID